MLTVSREDSTAEKSHTERGVGKERKNNRISPSPSGSLHRRQFAVTYPAHEVVPLRVRETDTVAVFPDQDSLIGDLHLRTLGRTLGFARRWT